MLRRAVAAFVLAVPLMAGSITPAERRQLIEHLEESRAGFLAEVVNLTDEQLNYRSSADSWTIYECAEHITVSEDNMFKDLEEKFLTLEPKVGVKSATPDATVLEYGTNRQLMRMKAAESYKPVGRWKTLPEMLEHFRESRSRTLEYAGKTQEDLRGRYLEPFQLDAYQYLLILSAHTQRHTNQIREIKASPSFPKNSPASSR